jgi:predicted AAA+ superfamily ATPase
MNPLLEKYEELYGKKEEKELKVIDEVSLSKEQLESLETYLSTTSGTCGIASVSTSSAYITASNANVSITPKLPTPNLRIFSSYDIYSINQSFLDVADQIKMNKAQVTNMEVSFDKNFGYNLSTKTLTFSVQVDVNP